MTNIVIIDDHQMIVDGLKSVIMADPSFRVVGSAPSLARGLALIQEHNPDVIILDIRLTDVSGVPVVERTRKISPKSVIIVLTGFGASLKEDCLRAGADIFLSKEAASDVIVRTIRQSAAASSDPWSTAVSALSPREREIAALAAGGKSNPEIADLLGLSINTVKTHLSHIMAKMGVSGRVGLALEWKRRGDMHTSA